MIKNNILKDIHPQDIKFSDNIVIQEFDNKFEYMYTLKEEGKYKQKVINFFDQVKNGANIDEKLIEQIRNQVRNSLIKRGIITGTLYEGYKYDVDGLIVDYAELASGNPECMMKPLKKYDKWFYELYINMSIPWNVEENDINSGAIRLIETIKALEELNVEIKVNVMMAARGMYTSGRDYIAIIPICNHLEFKDYNLLYPFVTGEFLRGPMFQTMRSGESVTYNLGYPVKFENALNLWEITEGYEVELAERVLNDIKGL